MGGVRRPDCERPTMLRLGFWVIAAAALQGCIAYTVASTAVSVTATAVETTVDVAAGAVDLVTPDGDDD